MALDYLHVNDLATATLDDTDQIIVGESNTFKKASVASLKGSIIGSDAEYSEDTAPYLSARKTKNAGIVGKVAMEKIVGGSLGWNQLCMNSSPFPSRAGLTVTASTDDFTISGSATEAVWAVGWYGLNNSAMLSLSEHVMFVSHKLLSGSTSNNSAIAFSPVNAVPSTYVTLGAKKIIKTPTLTSATGQCYWGCPRGTTFTNAKIQIQVIDLTLALGSTIADYIYQLETTTAGAGIAKLKEWGIDLDTYHAYDAGSIQSVEATAHVTKDANNNVIGNYPLGSDTLRGYPMLVNNKLAFDGDEKYPDGTIKRNFHKISGSDMTYVRTSSAGYKTYVYDSTTAGHTAEIQSYFVNNFTQNFVDAFSSASVSEECIQATKSGFTAIYIAIASSRDIASVEIVYKLKTPTTESSTPFQRIQTVDADGTESFTANTVVPVGHQTLIPENVLGALSVLVG